MYAEGKCNSNTWVKSLMRNYVIGCVIIANVGFKSKMTTRLKEQKKSSSFS